MWQEIDLIYMLYWYVAPNYSSGMLCCRAIRGSTTTFSNHAWGAAVDFNIGGVLDPRGDGKCQKGLLDLFPFMQQQGFYWGIFELVGCLTIYSRRILR